MPSEHEHSARLYCPDVSYRRTERFIRHCSSLRFRVMSSWAEALSNTDRRSWRIAPRSCALQKMVALLEEENEVGLHPHQALSTGRAIEIGVDKPLQLERLKADIPPDAGDVLL